MAEHRDRPTSAVERQIVVDGIAISYLEAGTGDPILLLHGWPTDSRLWTHQLETLSQDHTVLALDLPGFGRSGVAPGQSVTLRSLEETVIGVLRSLGLDSVSLIGHDVGAIIALLVAERHPERVERLVILNTTPFAHLPWIVRLLVRVCRVPGLRGLVTTRLGYRALFSIGTRLKTTDVGRLVDGYHEPIARDAARRTIVRDLMGGVDLGVLMELTQALGNVTAPTLILWGDRDVSAPMTVADRLHRLIPDSTLRVLHGCGHFAPEDDPDGVSDGLSGFLGTPDTGPGQDASP